MMLPTGRMRDWAAISIRRMGPENQYSIGDNPVYLFAHGAIAAAQAGLEMGDEQIPLLGR